MSQIFISHTHSDRAIAKALDDAVRGLFGERMNVTYSSSKEEGGIPPGQNWITWITEQVRNSSVALVLLTPASIQKPWVLWEAGAVAGSALADANADLRKVRPLLFQLEDSDVPAPFRHIQIPHGDRREDVEQFFNDLVDQYITNPKESRSAGQRLGKIADAYLEAVGTALLNAPLLPTEANIEEWCLRLDKLSHANRASEVVQMHQWLNLSFGREEGEVARPLDLRIHRRLGEIYLSAKNYKRAAEQFDLARRLAPRDIFVLRNLGQALVSDRDFPKAEKVLDSIARLDDKAFERNPECAALKGRWYGDQERWQQAHDVYQKAYDTTPQSYYLAGLLGQMKLRLKKLDEARQVYLSALDILNKLAEHNVWTHATAANAAIVTGDLTEARRHVAALRQLRPTPGEMESVMRGMKEVGALTGIKSEEIDSLCAALRL